MFRLSSQVTQCWYSVSAPQAAEAAAEWAAATTMPLLRPRPAALQRPLSVVRAPAAPGASRRWTITATWLDSWPQRSRPPSLVPEPAAQRAVPPSKHM